MSLYSCPTVAFWLLRDATYTNQSRGKRMPENTSLPFSVLSTCISVGQCDGGFRPSWVKRPLSAGPLTCISSAGVLASKQKEWGDMLKQKEPLTGGPRIVGECERRRLRRQCHSRLDEWMVRWVWSMRTRERLLHLKSGRGGWCCLNRGEAVVSERAFNINTKPCFLW